MLSFVGFPVSRGDVALKRAQTEGASAPILRLVGSPRGGAWAKTRTRRISRGLPASCLSAPRGGAMYIELVFVY